MEITEEYRAKRIILKHFKTLTINSKKNIIHRILIKDLYSQFKEDNSDSNMKKSVFCKLIRFNKIGFKKSNGNRYYTKISRKELKFQ